MLVKIPLSTYFGENTLQTNKWFLMSSRTMVYEVRAIELMSKGSKQGSAIILLRMLLNCCGVEISLLSFTDI